MSDFELQAFVTNLGKYNEGELVGEWVSFPVTPEEMRAVLDRIGIGHPDDFGVPYEEVFITDYDTDLYGVSGELGEYENLDKLNYLASRLEELSPDELEKYKAILESADVPESGIDGLINLTFNLDRYDIYPDISDEEDLGRYYVEESGIYDTKAMGALANYIDYEAFGRDVALDEGGHFTDHGYIRDDYSSWEYEFDGELDSIPAEYRLSGSSEMLEEPDESLLMAMEAAGYQYDAIESSKDNLRFIGEAGAVMQMESWDEAREWLEGVVFDDPEVAENVHNLLHPEKPAEMTVLVVEPMKEPRVVTMPTGLEALQKAVGGYIEAVYPFEDPVALICNEEGKFAGLELNRGLYDDKGKLYDILAGTFLVTGLTEDNFGSLSPELIEKYTDMYRTPQMFIRVNGELMAVPVKEAGKEQADALAAEIVDLFAKNGFDGYYDEPADVLSQRAASVSMLIQSGNDFPVRNMLLEVAKSNTEFSRESLEAVKKLDAFYHEQQVPRFSLYQIEWNNPSARHLAYASHKELEQQGQPIDSRNYTFVYSGSLSPGDTLESIYERFNLQHPADFRGHSLSVSDVIVLHQNGQDQAFYVDSFGFQQVPEFFAHNPLEKVEELLEDDYGMIDGIINNGDRRKEQEQDKKPSILEKLQEKKEEAARLHEEAAKQPRKRSQDLDLS